MVVETRLFDHHVETQMPATDASHLCFPRSGNDLQVVRQLRSFDEKAPVLMFTAMKGNSTRRLRSTPAQMTSSRRQLRFLAWFPCLRAHIRRSKPSTGESNGKLPKGNRPDVVEIALLGSDTLSYSEHVTSHSLCEVNW